MTEPRCRCVGKGYGVREAKRRKNFCEVDVVVSPEGGPGNVNNMTRLQLCLCALNDSNSCKSARDVINNV